MAARNRKRNRERRTQPMSVLDTPSVVSDSPRLRVYVPPPKPCQICHDRPNLKPYCRRCNRRPQ